jgi:hypothetical protein
MNIIENFDPVSLEEMDSVKLLNRVDTKYIFPLCDLEPVLTKMKSTCRVLEIEGNRQSRYETLYFDTPSNKLYLSHHNGKLNRIKIRYRRYVDCDLSFFEIKSKSNKGRTIKYRIKRKEISEEISGKSEELLREFTSFTPDMLEPSLWVFFSRMTFVNRNMKERLTIDTDLHFKLGQQEKHYPGLVIAELKQERSCSCFWTNLMKEHNIIPFKISKFCIGISSLNPGIKQNNFKPKLHKINKINSYVR